jgi:hypothetical protein
MRTGNQNLAFYSWDRHAIRGLNSFLRFREIEAKRSGAEKRKIGSLHPALANDHFLPLDFFAILFHVGVLRKVALVWVAQPSRPC